MNRTACLLMLLLCCASVAFAQTDSCAGVSRDTDKVQKTITISSPEMSLMIKNVITDGVSQITLNFNTRVMAASDEAGLYILFEDGKRMRFFGQHITRAWLNARDGYSYETTLNCSNALLEQLKRKKISVFQIAGIDVTVNEVIGEEFQDYVNCVTKQ